MRVGDKRHTSQKETKSERDARLVLKQRRCYSSCLLLKEDWIGSASVSKYAANFR